MRTACVIAVARANEVFEPLMHQVGVNSMGESQEVVTWEEAVT